MAGDGAPLTPSGSTAHGWLERELAKPAYADQRSLLQRVWDWAMEHLNDILNSVGSALPVYVLIPLLLALAGLVVFAMTRLRGRGAATAGAQRDGVLADVALTADQLRRRATQSAADGALSAAFVDFFRSVARRGEERALLLPQPGRTAHEVGEELASYFPAQAIGLRAAALHFDSIRYGGADATTADVDRIRALAHDVEHARPQHAPHPQATA